MFKHGPNPRTSRWLIISVISCQALCLAAGLTATLSWMNNATTAIIYRHVQADSQNDDASESRLPQRLQETRAAVDQSLTPIYRLGIFLIIMLTLGGIGMSAWMVHGLEKRMAYANEDLERTIARRTQDMIRARNAAIVGLAKLAEYRDPDTGRHLQRISKYAELLAKCLRDEEPQRYPMVTDAWIDDLVLGSALHDIGKVGIPDSILHKSGQLTPDERALIEDHPIIAGECIQLMEEEFGDSNLLRLAREIAYSHHDWWDGTGYPFKLEGEAIPLSARIVALADVYDALTTDRTYKRAMPHREVREIIISGMGKQFDPYIVGAFLLREDEFRKVAKEINRSDLVRSDEQETADQALVPSALDQFEILR